MSWLNLVLSVPGVGLRVKPSLEDSVSHSEIVAPLMDQLVEEIGDATFEAAPPAGIAFKTSDGFSHNLSLDNLVVQFAYPVTTRRATGQLPVIESTKQCMYSELAGIAIARLVRILKCFEKSHRFSVNRVGFIAAARLAKDSLPPGLKALLKYLEVPWGKQFIKFNCNFLAPLAEAEGYRDQCHHVLNMDTSEKDHPDEVEVKLDWQRMFEPNLNLSATDLEPKLSQWYDLAMSYFEGLGKGVLKIV